MPHKCKCGGKLSRADLFSYYDTKLKRTMIKDTNPFLATWRCDQCGVIRTQRKRSQYHLAGQGIYFQCPVCKAKFPSITETDWDLWLAHLVEEKRIMLNKALNSQTSTP